MVGERSGWFRLARTLREAAAWEGFHSQAGTYLRRDAIRARQKLALAIVETVANVLAFLCRQVEEHLPVIGLDLDPVRRTEDVFQLRDSLSLGVVEVEFDAEVAFGIGGDPEDDFLRRPIEERDRGAWTTIS
jgi:hypothetical protein